MERPRGQGHNNRFLTVFWQDAVFLSGAAWQPFREAQHGSIFQRCGMAVFFRGAACQSFSERCSMAASLRGAPWQGRPLDGSMVGRVDLLFCWWWQAGQPNQCAPGAPAVQFL
eukprot:scaffold45187_cov21-Tisochrysis_lutea.AAC.1